MSMSVVANRVTSSTSSSSSSQIKQEHVKDENNDNSSRNNNNKDFFDDWNVGNWCWERDYNKYPVVVVSLHTANNNNNNNCHDNGIGINDRSNDAKMNTTEHYEQCDDDRKLWDNDIDERKPAAITYSSIDPGRRSVTTTTAATMEIATATKKDDREISISKNPQIKVENNDENKNTTNDINDFNNDKYNDDDDDDDDSFYDDWVEGNWCLLDNSDNSNGEVEGKGNNDNSPRKMKHEITTTPNLRKKSRSNSNESAKRKLKRSRYDDDDDSYNEDDVDEEEESDDEDSSDDNKDEEEFIPKDNKVHNQYQEDKRPAKKWTQRQTHYDNHCNQLWMGMFQELVEYKKQHKNNMIPPRHGKEPKLGHWFFTQRCKYKNNELRPNRIELLNTIGFEWDGTKGIAATDQIKWMNMFQKLVAYKKQHKTTLVPAYYEEDPKLGYWVIKQRQVYRKDKLLPNRCALLKSIGFELYISKEKNQQLWMNMFQKLVEYNEKHKNTLVPQRYMEDPKLGRWVSKQRRSGLLPARIALLKSIGFT